MSCNMFMVFCADCNTKLRLGQIMQIQRMVNASSSELANKPNTNKIYDVCTAKVFTFFQNQFCYVL